MTLRIPTNQEVLDARATWQQAMNALTRAKPYSSAAKVADQAEVATWERYKEIEKAYEHNLVIEMSE